MSETTAVVVPMPHMGVSVEEGTVVEWHKQVGEEVAAEEVLCEIATDKVDTEVPAPADGVLAKILAEEGATVAVGEPLAELTVSTEAAAALEPAQGGEPSGPETVPSAPSAAPEPTAPSAASAAPEPTAPAARAATAGISVRAAAGRDEHGRFDPAAAADAATSVPREGPLASPLARRIAARHAVDLESVTGSGRHGRIRKADVEEAIAAGNGGGAGAARPEAARAPAAAGPGELPRGYDGIPHEVVATSRVRRAIAEHMTRSRQTAAHMTTEVDVDLSAAVRARAELNERRAATGEPKISFLPFIARAACAALAEHPDLNATFQGERMIRWQVVNLGVAVDTPEGLLVPVVRDCQALTAAAIGDAISDLAERARGRELAPDDLAGGTFTISNPGSVGAVSAQAIINQPQVAILGLPAIQRRPWVVADEHGQETIGIRSILRLAVTFDHRAVDGADATRFAVAVKDHLEAWGPEAYA